MTPPTTDTDHVQDWFAITVCDIFPFVFKFCFICVMDETLLKSKLKYWITVLIHWMDCYIIFFVTETMTYS